MGNVNGRVAAWEFNQKEGRFQPKVLTKKRSHKHTRHNMSFLDTYDEAELRQHGHAMAHDAYHNNLGRLLKHSSGKKKKQVVVFGKKK